jgi:hypothetical protein
MQTHFHVDQLKLRISGLPIFGFSVNFFNSSFSFRTVVIFFLFFILSPFGLFVPSVSWGATYYVNGAAANDSGLGTETSPKKYITSGIGLMVGGDTLIIEDGTYTGANNMIGDSPSPQIYPPSGAAGAYTTIRARNIGQVIINGEYLRTPFGMVGTVGKNYLHIDGIHFQRGIAGVFSVRGLYNKVTNCGFEDGQAPNSEAEVEIASVIGGSAYTLVEDCWIWGKGRYGLYTSSSNGGANRVIFRRVVVRFDDTPDGRATAGFRFYNGSTSSMQNSIVIDANASPTAYYPDAFATGGGSSISGEPNHTFYGLIALNNPTFSGFHFERSSTTYPVQNSVVWGNDMGIESSGSNLQGFTINAINVTAGNNAVREFYRNVNYTLMHLSITNSLAVTKSGGTSYAYPTMLTTSEHYVATGGTAGQSTGSTAITKAVLDAKLKYLPRTESGTNGATILYQTGVSGTLHGEAGWNVTTNKPLWPLANESIWSAKMKAYTASGPGGNRGFAALSGSTATPLTDYIWGYLGNPKPANIYGGPVAPAPPQKVIATPAPVPPAQ